MRKEKKIIVQIYGVQTFSFSPLVQAGSIPPFVTKGRFSQSFSFFSQQISWGAPTHTLLPSSAQTRLLVHSEIPRRLISWALTSGSLRIFAECSPLHVLEFCNCAFPIPASSYYCLATTLEDSCYPSYIINYVPFKSMKICPG